MPLYEYICRDCGQPFEKMIRLSDSAPVIACPECGSTDTRKQLSTFAAFGNSGSKSSTAAASSCGSTGRFG
jgi:putative FmdB family regulatory protein